MTVRYLKGALSLVKEATSSLRNAEANNTKVPLLVTSLVLLSGRRVAELLSGKIILQEGTTKSSIIFQEHPEASRIEIPLLCSPELFSKGIRLLIKLEEKELERRAATVKYQSAVNYYIGKNLSFEDRSVKPKVGDIRHAYAQIAYKQFGYDSTGMTLAEFTVWVFGISGHRTAILPKDETRVRGALRVTGLVPPSPPAKLLRKIEARSLI